MDEGREEKTGERMIQHALEKLGLYVRHIDCSIDGFPDLIVIGSYAVLVEMKFVRGDPSISSVFESSQPVFFYDMDKVGCDSALLCVFNGEDFWVGRPEKLLKKSMAGEHMSSVIGEHGCLMSLDYAAKMIALHAGVPTV